MSSYGTESQIGVKSGGDCFEVAGNLMLGCGFIKPPKRFLPERAYVVHALVDGQGPLRGRRFAHAWVEHENNVIDFSNGKTVVMYKTPYYIIGGVASGRPREFAKYSLAQFRQKVLEHEHWGPWDLKGDL